MKSGLEESNQVVEQMEKNLASKEEENMSLISQIEKLLRSDERMKELMKENDDLQGQYERCKIKVWFDMMDFQVFDLFIIHKYLYISTCRYLSLRRRWKNCSKT